ncbi:MAG: hypothetical protein LBR65_08510 [Culturomica sp.]|jgi:hypothetical protein|nr:hypothetical protein [Culturomica sp.]
MEIYPEYNLYLQTCGKALENIFSFTVLFCGYLCQAQVYGSFGTLSGATIVLFSGLSDRNPGSPQGRRMTEGKKAVRQQIFVRLPWRYNTNAFILIRHTLSLSTKT